VEHEPVDPDGSKDAPGDVRDVRDEHVDGRRRLGASRRDHDRRYDGEHQDGKDERTAEKRH
jgi:hypothetical protein